MGRMKGDGERKMASTVGSEIHVDAGVGRHTKVSCPNMESAAQSQAGRQGGL